MGASIINPLVTHGRDAPSRGRVPPEIRSGEPAAEGRAVAKPGAQQAYRERLEIGESMELVLQTREGDVVTLKLNRYQSQEFSALQRPGLQAFSYEAERGSHFELSVKGNLSDDELQSISRIMEVAKGVAGSVFSGNMQDAWDQAQELMAPDSEIASLALDVERVSSRKMAAYASVASLQPERELPAVPADVETGLLKQLDWLAEPLAVLQSLWQGMGLPAGDSSRLDLLG